MANQDFSKSLFYVLRKKAWVFYTFQSMSFCIKLVSVSVSVSTYINVFVFMSILIFRFENWTCNRGKRISFRSEENLWKFMQKPWKNSEKTELLSRCIFTLEINFPFRGGVRFSEIFRHDKNCTTMDDLLISDRVRTFRVDSFAVFPQFSEALYTSLLQFDNGPLVSYRVLVMWHFYI